MGASDRWNNAVTWVVNHAALAALVVTILGAIGGAVTASMSLLEALAPFSYFVGGLLGAILAVAVLWLALAFIRYVRHGTIGGVAESPRGDAGASLGIGPSSPRPPEPQDVWEAKQRLATFAANTLTPAIRTGNAALNHVAQAAAKWNPESPISNFAFQGIWAASMREPDPISLEAERIRPVPIGELDRSVTDYIVKYMRLLTTYGQVIDKMLKDTSLQRTPIILSTFKDCYRAYEASFEEIETLSKDIHFPMLRDQWARGQLKLSVDALDPLITFDIFN